MTGIANPANDHPLTQMILGYEQGELDHARDYAEAVLDQPVAEIETDPHGPATLIYARAILSLTDAHRATYAKDDPGAVRAFSDLEEIAAEVDWEAADTMVTRHFRRFALTALIERQCAEITLAIADHNADIAARLVRKLESHRPGLEALLDPSPERPDENLPLQAGFLLAKMYKAGGIVHLKLASLGRNVKSAARFFRRFDGLADRLPPGVRDDPVWRVSLRETELAAQRVEAELLAEEGRYDAAIETFEEVALALEDLAPEVPHALPNAEIWRDHLMNYAREAHARVEHCAAMAQLKRQLDQATAQQGSQADRLNDLESFHREAMLAMARKDMGVTVNNTIDVRNFVRVRNEIAVTVQDQAMDEVLALLRKLPDDAARKKLEKDAAAAKAEKDMAAKIKRVAAVLDGTAKLVEAGAKLVPYGPAVVSALKGVFALLPERVEETRDPGPDVVDA